MKKIIAIVLVISVIVAIPGDLAAKERRGIDLVIQRIDGEQVRGELIAVKKNSLLIMDSNSGLAMSVNIDKTRRIKIIKIVLISGAIGALFVLLTSPGDQGFFPISKTEGALIGFAAGAIIGWVVGGLATGITEKFETIEIEGKSEAEIEAILEKLRKKARMHDYN